jgi:hypothetical protein
MNIMDKTPTRGGAILAVLFMIATIPAAPASAAQSHDEGLPPAAYAKARADLAKVRADLDKIGRDLQGHDLTIRKAEDLATRAREMKNAEVEAAAREALLRVRDAKTRDEATRARLQDAMAGLQAGLEKARTAMGAWVQEYRALIAAGLTDAGTVYDAILGSLRDRRPPPAPPRQRFEDLRSGDVLLVAPPEGYGPGALGGKAILFADKLTSWEWGEGSSEASHSFIYLKTVNGRKLFLDDQLGEGPRIKTEEMILREYAGRAMDVAHPVARIDADRLWTAARELEIGNLDHIERSAAGFTTYNLVGDENMVCSEAARWALVRSWPGLDQENQLQDAPFKKLLGVYFGPANFYADRQDFIISGLDVPK